MESVRGQNDAWLDEYSMYHRKDGLLVKEYDDTLSAEPTRTNDAALRAISARQGIVQSRNCISSGVLLMQRIFIQNSATAG